MIACGHLPIEIFSVKAPCKCHRVRTWLPPSGGGIASPYLMSFCSYWGEFASPYLPALVHSNIKLNDSRSVTEKENEMGEILTILNLPGHPVVLHVGIFPRIRIQLFPVRYELAHHFWNILAKRQRKIRRPKIKHLRTQAPCQPFWNLGTHSVRRWLEGNHSPPCSVDAHGTHHTGAPAPSDLRPCLALQLMTGICPLDRLTCVYCPPRLWKM